MTALHFQLDAMLVVGWMPIILPWLFKARWCWPVFLAASAIVAGNAFFPIWLKKPGGGSGEGFGWLLFVVIPSALIIIVGFITTLLARTIVGSGNGASNEHP
jgi:hypothetical protein